VVSVVGGSGGRGSWWWLSVVGSSGELHYINNATPNNLCQTRLGHILCHVILCLRLSGSRGGGIWSVDMYSRYPGLSQPVFPLSLFSCLFNGSLRAMQLDD
jgi:hypothetical protein